jgi:hypothetical protein
MPRWAIFLATELHHSKKLDRDAHTRYPASTLQADSLVAVSTETVAWPSFAPSPLSRASLRTSTGSPATMPPWPSPCRIARHGIHRGRLRAGERALMVGVGGIGMFATWVASRLGASVTAVDLDPKRLEIAARLGATAVLASADVRLTDVVEAGAYDVIYEVTGTRQALEDALALVAPGTRRRRARAGRVTRCARGTYSRRRWAVAQRRARTREPVRFRDSPVRGPRRSSDHDLAAQRPGARGGERPSGKDDWLRSLSAVHRAGARQDSVSWFGTCAEKRRPAMMDEL